MAGFGSRPSIWYILTSTGTYQHDITRNSTWNFSFFPPIGLFIYLLTYLSIFAISSIVKSFFMSITSISNNIIST